MLGTRLGIIEPASFSTFAFSAFHAFTHLQIIINNPKCNDKLNLNYNTDSEISNSKQRQHQHLMDIQSPAGLIQPRIDHLVGAHFLKSVFFCWRNSLYKNTSINITNCNPPQQTYYQLPTKICHHRALSLESAVNVRSVEGRCTDPASICSPQILRFRLESRISHPPARN